MTPAEIIVTATGAYLALGALFAIGFAWRGAASVDPDARLATWGFRVLVLPGATLLWPLLAARWISATAPSEGEPRGALPMERTPHKDALRRGAAR